MLKLLCSRGWIDLLRMKRLCVDRMDDAIGERTKPLSCFAPKFMMILDKSTREWCGNYSMMDGIIVYYMYQETCAIPAIPASS